VRSLSHGERAGVIGARFSSGHKESRYDSSLG
jgi:hypothetical protein